ncbi:MAG: hypothetical protein R3E56_17610 [Burkholderiaceae bacterium]
MSRAWLRWALGGVVLGCATLAAVVGWEMRAVALPEVPGAPSPEPALLERGAYLARAGNLAGLPHRARWSALRGWAGIERLGTVYPATSPPIR